MGQTRKLLGTPIGLPGPPHIPLGVPAGLKKHVIANHTRMHIPSPVRKFKIDVREKPGFSYPAPVKHLATRRTAQEQYGDGLLQQ